MGSAAARQRALCAALALAGGRAAVIGFFR